MLGMNNDAATDGNDDDSTSTDAADDDDDDVECGHYSYKFDAEHHLHHFNTILKAYGQNVNDLFVAFLSDNASVNRKTARLAGVPHLPCQNHTHALDVGEWWCCSVVILSVLAYLSLSNLIGELSKSKAKISQHANHVRDILLAVKGSTV